MHIIRTFAFAAAMATGLGAPAAHAAGIIETKTARTTVALAPADKLASNAEAASKLDISEIEKLFAGKTWIWGETGGGYFNKTRDFVAFNVNPDSPTTAEGRWRLYESGKICLDANWKTRKVETKSLTCFAMREAADKTIYMKREPAGPWFVFRSPTPSAGDEAARLVDGDKVTARLDEAERLGSAKKK